MDRIDFFWFVEALARHVGFSLDVPFKEIDPRHQRAILHGTGEAWIPLNADPEKPAKTRRKNTPPATEPTLAFQYKGLFPAIDEAVARQLCLSPEAGTSHG